MTNKFSECFIHIGTPKTGTTSLQKFFVKNRKNFEENDFLYPKTLGKDQHARLYLAVANYKTKTHMHLQAGITNEKLYEDFHNKIKLSFQKEIENTNCSRLLISSESYSRHLEGNEINDLKKFLDNFVEKFKIIVYIRPQHEFSISRIPTQLQLGQKKLDLIGKPTENPIYDYDKLLSRWEKVFGKENLIPKIFSRNEFPDGDIKKDFLRILGLDLSKFNDVKNLNESINVDALRFMVGINQYLPWSIDNKVNPYRANIFELVSHNRNGKGLSPTSEKAKKFFDYFTKSNEKVREKWFPERNELFEVDFGKYPKQDQQYAEIDNSAFKIFAELWSEKQKKILVQNKTIRAQMYIINEQYDEAIIPLKEALKIQPNHLFALQSICHSLIKLKKYSEANEYLKTALSFYPENDFFKKITGDVGKENNFDDN